MKLPVLCSAILFSILRCLALLIPSRDRENWLAEWEGELTFVLRRDRGIQAFIFASGALKDAAWFLRDHVQTATARQLRYPSWILCLVRLMGLLAFTYVCSRPEVGFSHPPFADLYDVRVDASPANVVLQIFIALATLPAITSLHLGHYPAVSFTGSRRVTATFWIFFVSKALVVMITSHFVGLSVAHLAESAAILCNSPQAYRAIRDGLTPLQFLVTFASCLYGLRWVLQDQRRRCPVCLQRLSSLQSRGRRAHIFLGVSCSERSCVNGHGASIVPEFETSWGGAQSWELPEGP